MDTATLSPLAEFIVAACLLTGSLFVFIGSLGLARLPDFYCRLHAPSKATTLGLGATLIASSIYFSMRGEFSIHELLIVFFVFITTPVSAHLMAKAALHRRLPNVSGAAMDLQGTDGDE